MNIITSKSLLIAVSAWKIFWTAEIVVKNDGILSFGELLSDGMSAIYMSAIITYASYKIPAMQKEIETWMKDIEIITKISEEKNEWFADPKNINELDKNPKLRAEILESELEMAGILEWHAAKSKEYNSYANNTREAVKDFNSKDPVLIENVLVPALIILLIFMNYTTSAVVIHGANEFLQFRFQQVGEFEFALTQRYVKRPGLLGILDFIALLLIIIPPKYLQKLANLTQRVILLNILRRKDSYPQMAFIDACAKGDKLTMKHILSKHSKQINVNARIGSTGNTGLHIACQHGHLNIVQSILDCEMKNVKLDLQNIHGFTPLDIAASVGHKFIVKRLLKSKNLKLSSDEVEKSVLVATQQENYECAKMILTEYRTRKGKDFDSALATYIIRVEESLRKNDRKSVDNFKKAIQAWFMSRNAAKTEQKGRAKKSREEMWQDIQDHFECSICYEEFRGGEIYSCENDHWMCLVCKNSWTINCPTCRTDFGENGPLRRHKVEKILVDIAAFREIMEEKPHTA